MRVDEDISRLTTFCSNSRFLCVFRTKRRRLDSLWNETTRQPTTGEKIIWFNRSLVFECHCHDDHDYDDTCAHSPKGSVDVWFLKIKTHQQKEKKKTLMEVGGGLWMKVRRRLSRCALQLFPLELTASTQSLQSNSRRARGQIGAVVPSLLLSSAALQNNNSENYAWRPPSSFLFFKKKNKEMIAPHR